MAVSMTSATAACSLNISPELSRGLLGVVNKCNSFLTSPTRSQSIPFRVDEKLVGLLRPKVAEKLRKFPKVFVDVEAEVESIEYDEPLIREELHLSEDLRDYDERTKGIATVLEKLRAKDVFPSLRGWRDELYDVRENFASENLFSVERSASGLFGIAQYGVHVNGYTVDSKGVVRMWIARRSSHKPTWPGRLDNMCAGGLASGLGVRECLIKECHEEADIPNDLLKNLKSAGCVSYVFENERGIQPETEFIYDLYLPESFEPRNVDGEVAGFQLMTLDSVVQKIVTDEFKPNCALIILDFLIRHGYVTADNEPNFCTLVEQMHYPLQNLSTLLT